MVNFNPGSGYGSGCGSVRQSNKAKRNEIVYLSIFAVLSSHVICTGSKSIGSIFHKRCEQLSHIANWSESHSLAGGSCITITSASSTPAWFGNKIIIMSAN